jgi:membrane-associated phospholipid phosphatase
MRIRSLAVAAATLTLASVAPAQSVGNMLKDDFKNGARDIGAIWTAPFDAEGRDWMLVGIALAGFGGSMLADQEVSDWAVANREADFFTAIKPLRRGGVLFSGKYVVPPVAALYIVGLATKNQGMRDFVMGCMASWGAQGIARRGSAYLFGRARPDTMPNDPQNWELGGGWGNWQMRSFPAGHFANVMGCATFANKRFKLGAAEPLIYAIAAGVGVGRMADEAHWLSDTVLGGVLGYAVGSEVARRSLKRNAARTGTGPALNVNPAIGGLDVSLRWTF